MGGECRHPFDPLLGEVVAGVGIDDRHDSVRDRRLVHVHEVEGLPGIHTVYLLRRPGEIHGVAGGCRNRHGNPGEGRTRRIVQMARKDAANIGACDHLGETLLVT